jgi:Carbohydrate binding domain
VQIRPVTALSPLQSAPAPRQTNSAGQIICVYRGDRQIRMGPTGFQIPLTAAPVGGVAGYGIGLNSMTDGYVISAEDIASRQPILSSPWLSRSQFQAPVAAPTGNDQWYSFKLFNTKGGALQTNVFNGSAPESGSNQSGFYGSPLAVILGTYVSALMQDTTSLAINRALYTLPAPPAAGGSFAAPTGALDVLTMDILSPHVNSGNIITAGVVAAIDGSLYFCWQATHNGNLIPVPNGGFESATVAPWSFGEWGGAGATLTISTAQHFEGNQSGLVGGLLDSGNAAVFQVVTGLTNAESYRISAWFYVDLIVDSEVFFSLWVDDGTGNNFVSTPATVAKRGTVPGWQQLALTYTANATTHVGIHLVINGSARAYWDDVQIKEAGLIYQLFYGGDGTIPTSGGARWFQAPHSLPVENIIANYGTAVTSDNVNYALYYRGDDLTLRTVGFTVDNTAGSFFPVYGEDLEVTFDQAALTGVNPFFSWFKPMLDGWLINVPIPGGTESFYYFANADFSEYWRLEFSQNNTPSIGPWSDYGGNFYTIDNAGNVYSNLPPLTPAPANLDIPPSFPLPRGFGA